MSNTDEQGEQARLLGLVDAEADRRAAGPEAAQDDEQAMVEVGVPNEGSVLMTREASWGWDERYWR
ncbi:hypothetical protein [Rhodococcus wratislaviensis]|uniref:hypothetical protein n=1 Tax=Rhodococcus wratislaviensis TaxID=44752 RepID=UPI0035167834